MRVGCLLLSSNLSNTVHTRNCRATNQIKNHPNKNQDNYKQVKQQTKRTTQTYCTKQRVPLTKNKNKKIPATPLSAQFLVACRLTKTFQTPAFEDCGLSL
jgi:hypothetical protein